MSRPSKYVVLYETDTGYMDCVAICDKSAEAYGEAYLALIDGLDEDSYYVTLPVYREGENGFIIYAVDKVKQKILSWVTILFYRPETEMEVDNENNH